MAAGTGLVSPSTGWPAAIVEAAAAESTADYKLRIAAGPIEIAPKRIVSGITYNGRFPGPLFASKREQPVTVEVQNETDTPEQLHWHGQFVSPDVDGAAEEGTPYDSPRMARGA